MDDKLIRLLIGWSLPAPLCLCIIYKFFCCIRDLLALLRSQDEPFKPVECVVVDYGEDSTAPLKGYNVSVKRLDGVISRELIPYNYYLDYPRETVKEYIGRHMTFYAKDSAPRHLFCEKDIVSQKAVKKEIKDNVVCIPFFLLLIALSIWQMIDIFHDIY